MKYKQIIIGLLFAGLVMVLHTGHASAATITVDSTADTVSNDSTCTLREAVAAADTDTGGGAGECAAGSGNDTIQIPAGTYTLTSDLDLGDTGITLNGANVSTVIINGGGSYGMSYVGVVACTI